ncbi:DUF4442 domain-containing protein [Desulfurispirillum indicum]|uniref:DUF4442 domain-containing protein n=1 Tax=Desulfurispirillum indicum TaxID=936456 RepID=UPI001CFA704C|nr:DUF4442 domain-containing protein [Desulfurispirillum indicum]UCZ55544.1 DUF4442 domain-containing protein [Desulfurispirillum indicum]
MKGFALLRTLLGRARHSKFWLWVLNLVLGRMIPFNRPHGFCILSIDEKGIMTTAPYRRSNFNHIRGIHACAIATIAEFSSGITLLSHIDPSRFRLIMARLEVEYAYQAKSRLRAVTDLTEQQIAEEFLRPLQTDGVVQRQVQTRVYDQDDRLVATGFITWQVKSWELVRTRVE